MLNVREVVSHLKTRYAPATVQLQYLEGLPHERTAQIYQNATVLIWVHGAGGPPRCQVVRRCEADSPRPAAPSLTLLNVSIVQRWPT